MKTVIYTQDANPAVYCETHAIDAIATLSELKIAYSAELEATNSECITCLNLASANAVALALSMQSE